MTIRVKTKASLLRRRLKLLKKMGLPEIVHLQFPVETKYFNLPGCSTIVTPLPVGRYRNIKTLCKRKAQYSVNGSLHCELHAGTIAARALADFIAMNETRNAEGVPPEGL